MLSRFPRTLRVPLRPSYASAPRNFFRIRNIMSATVNQTPTDEEHIYIPFFSFQEEPLGLPASESFGYFQGGPGLSFGPANRYKLQGKLGVGTASTVWLAHDHVDDKYVAIKILKGYATQMNQECNLRELEVFQRLLTHRGFTSDRCSRLLGHFIHPGIEEDGEHLCFVTELFWSNLESSQIRLRDRSTPVAVVKTILRHVLSAMARLHSLGIVHTDVKSDNVMIDLGPQWTTDAITKWLLDNPPSTYPPERRLNGMVSVFRSKSFTPPTVDGLFSCSFKLADFSNAQFVDDQTTDDVVPFSLRPPEVILGGEWNESVDIWTLGSMVFELLSGQRFFKKKEDGSEMDVLLHQMMIFCGDFAPEFLERCPRTSEYFTLECQLKKFPSYERKSIGQYMLDTGCVLSSQDLEGATNFMGKCLCLDPKDRATAQELLEHPWLKQ